MATTPPPRAVVYTPPTPLHGAKYDNSNTRKSTRQSSRRSQRAVNGTPPPLSNTYHSTSRTLPSNFSPPSSNPTSPQTRGTKRTRGNLNGTAKDESPSAISAHMDSSSTSNYVASNEQGTLNPASNMLPTPAKTPRKKDLRKTAEIQSAARVLFPGRLEKIEDAMPDKKARRGGRKNVGFSLDSSAEDEDSNRIQIFTDSKEKIPELDLSEDNPFIDMPEENIRQAESHRGSERRGLSVPAKSNPHIEDAFNREEGMIYVFRGRKIYRRFTPDPDHPNLSSEETEIECSTSPRRRPMTRASVKPRLLFPTEKQRHERELADEEALTDIEDKTQENLVTPIKQSFTNASATPPTTGHATRSATRKAAVNGRSSPLVGLMEAAVEESMTATKRRPRKKTSPFDGWQRTKAGKGRKRGAEQIDQDGEDVRGKKVKGNASP